MRVCLQFNSLNVIFLSNPFLKINFPYHSHLYSVHFQSTCSNYNCAKTTMLHLHAHSSIFTESSTRRLLISSITSEVHYNNMQLHLILSEYLRSGSSTGTGLTRKYCFQPNGNVGALKVITSHFSHHTLLPLPSSSLQCFRVWLAQQRAICQHFLQQ